jgi:hypothetical protein
MQLGYLFILCVIMSFVAAKPIRCKSHDLNVDILGQVGLLNGLLGNAINGEANPGATSDGVGNGC